MEHLTPALNSQLNTIKCENCRSDQQADKKFCTDCSFPIHGTEQEKYSFRLILSSRKRLLTDAESKVKGAKTMIYVASGLFFVSGLIMYSVSDDLAALIVNLFICLIYLILAAWSTNNPFAAILTAFIVYVTIQMVNAFDDPSTIYKGIILKIVLIAAFYNGIRSALAAKNIMKELEKFKAVPGGGK
jgi:hypothetical protein